MFELTAFLDVMEVWVISDEIFLLMLRFKSQ